MPIQDCTKKPIAKMVSLQGKVAVVTGGAQGIGLAIVRRLVEAGARVLIVDIDKSQSLKKTVASLQKNKGKDKIVIGIPLDARSAQDMEWAANEAVTHFGQIDIWVNNAGIYPQKEFLKLEERLLNDVLDTNIKGVIYGAQSAAKRMQKKGGVILNIASVSGYIGEEEMVHYNATKFAVRGITAGLAKELGKKNIRVVAIAPTLVDTPGVHDEFPDIKKEMKETAASLPLGRVSVPDDIARMAFVLVSDLSAYVTGTTFVVDGGNMAVG